MAASRPATGTYTATPPASSTRSVRPAKANETASVIPAADPMISPPSMAIPNSRFSAVPTRRVRMVGSSARPNAATIRASELASLSADPTALLSARSSISTASGRKKATTTIMVTATDMIMSRALMGPDRPA